MTEQPGSTRPPPEILSLSEALERGWCQRCHFRNPSLMLMRWAHIPDSWNRLAFCDHCTEFACADPRFVVVRVLDGGHEAADPCQVLLPANVVQIDSRRPLGAGA